ncbi:MAG: hypothetical protein IJS08_16425, partial [Victivallales bacterium]|nr:hypothetical protein [Victivallales bacterium]
ILAAMFALLLDSIDEITIQKAPAPPKLDGVIDVDEWGEPLPFPFKEIVSLKEAEYPTEVRMQYDDEYIYVALKCTEIISSTGGSVFSQPRYELRFGKLPEIKVWAVSLDGIQRYPMNGWEAVGANGTVEVRIPLRLLSGFRIYSCNIVRDNGKGGSSMFPIGTRNYGDLASMKSIFLGSTEEIAEAEKMLADKHLAERKIAAEYYRRFIRKKKAEVVGANAKKLAIAPAWKPYRFFSGADFHFMFTPMFGNVAGVEAGSKFVPNGEGTLPLFQSAAYQVHAWYLNRGFRDKKEPLAKLLNDPESNPAGYILRNTGNPISYSTEGLYNTFENEVSEKKESREEFVRKYGSRLLCVEVNESIGPNGGAPMIFKLAEQPLPKNKKEAYELMRKISFDPARTYIRDWSVFYPELAPFRAPTAATATDHMFLSFGFGMAGQEAGPKTLDMPFSHAISRGAARQYGRPMRYFTTTHDTQLMFPGCDKFARHYTHNTYRLALRPNTRQFSISQRTGGLWSNVHGPNYGVPKEDWRRCFIYNYMAGGNLYYDESGYHFMYANYNWKTIEKEDPLAVNLREPKKYLSDMGEMMADFYERIVSKEDRGVVYAPIALVWDLYHGNFRNYMTIPWGCIPATEGDLMMWGVEDALFPRSERIYYNRGFRTSPYGDIFDVVTNDASADFLETYPVLFFCGDVPIDKAFAKKLVAYVRKGGTLVINWKQLEPFSSLFPRGFAGVKVTGERKIARFSYSTFSKKLLTEEQDFCYTGVKLQRGTQVAVLTADNRQDPLVTVSKYGKGKVVLSLPDFLKEQYTTRMLEIFKDLMAELNSEALPLVVEGDVQYLVQRNEKGWMVSLFNNYGSGFSRTWDDPLKKPDPMYDVTVTIKPKFKYEKVREWFTGGKKLTLKVPAGDVRIVEIVKLNAQDANDEEWTEDSD